MMVRLPWASWPRLGSASSSRGNLTLLPSVSPAAQPCLGEASTMEPHRRRYRCNGCSTYGCPASPGSHKDASKALDCNWSPKTVCVRKEPNVTSFSPGCLPPSLTPRWFTTEQEGAGCPSPSEADILWLLPDCIISCVTLLAVVYFHTSDVSLSWCIVTDALRGVTLI